MSELKQKAFVVGCVIFGCVILGVIIFFLIKAKATTKDTTKDTTIDKAIYDELKFSKLFIWIDKINPYKINLAHPFPESAKISDSKELLFQGNAGNAGEWRIKMITLPDKSVVFRFIYWIYFVSFNPNGDGYYDRQQYNTYQTIDSNNNLKQVSKCDVNLPIKYVDFTFYKKDPSRALYLFRNVFDTDRFIIVQNNINAELLKSEVKCG